MNYSQQDIWMLQMAEFFVTRYNYTTVAVQQAKEEIWLVNPTQVVYPVIRLSKKEIDNEFFDEERITQIHRAILDMLKREGKRLDIHVVASMEIQKGESVDKVCLQPGWIPDGELMSMFPGIGGVVHISDNPKLEYAHISKNIEQFQMEMFKQERKKQLAKHQKNPYVTIAVGVLCIFIYGLSFLLGNLSEDAVAISIMLGSYYKAFVVGLNEWYRLLTAGFVHIDFFHLLMNLMALHYLGNLCEQIYGHVKYASILVLSIIMGSLFVFIGDGNGVTLGLSGGLYGLMGAMLVYFWSSGMLKQPLVRRQFINMLTVNLLISFMPGISLLGHLGGFIGGLFVAMLVMPIKKCESMQKHFRIAFLLLCVALGVLTYNMRQLNDEFYGTDLKVAEIASKLEMNGYAKRISEKMYDFYQK